MTALARRRRVAAGVRLQRVDPGTVAASLASLKLEAGGTLEEQVKRLAQHFRKKPNELADCTECGGDSQLTFRLDGKVCCPYCGVGDDEGHSAQPSSTPHADSGNERGDSDIESDHDAGDPGAPNATDESSELDPTDGLPLDLERGDHAELAQALIARPGEDDEIIFDEGAFWRYLGGLWREVPASELSRVVQSWAGVPVGPDSATLRVRHSDVAGTLRLAADLVARPGFFAGATEGLVFSNGVLVLRDDGVELLSHSPDHRARHGYGFAFDAGADCTRWAALLEETFCGDDDSAEKIALLQEFAGACLFGISPRFQKCVAMTDDGGGGTGKSTVADVIAGSMPDGSVVAIAPQSWASEYRLALLAGKRLNVCSELPEADIIASETFKAVITGDATTARHIREAPFTFRPVAGHLFAANTLPGTNDQSHGFWRRLLLIKFNRRIAPERVRVGLASDVLREERAGVVAWALQGARRLMQRGAYTVPASSPQAVEAWRRNADAVAAFVAEMTDCTESARTAPAALYRAYVQWAKDNGHRQVASNKFGARLKGLGIEVHRGAQGARWYPLRLRGDAVTDLVTDSREVRHQPSN